ncbi:hypothetical protein SAMN04515618_101393 [Collimonas sp. OK307]|nr:hypothetical protein SAMN04515618_101393 [Collimonas sp. OK307]
MSRVTSRKLQSQWLVPAWYLQVLPEYKLCANSPLLTNYFANMGGSSLSHSFLTTA